MTASKVLAVAGYELRVGLRNRWVIAAVSILTLFAVVLSPRCVGVWKVN